MPRWIFIDSDFRNRNIKALIIDEADRILEVGFEDEVSSFGATFPSSVLSFGSRIASWKLCRIGCYKNCNLFPHTTRSRSLLKPISIFFVPDVGPQAIWGGI